MKKYLSFLLALSATLFVFGQAKQVPAKQLEISYDKTLHLVFDNKVKYIDATQDIIPEIHPVLQNIVKVKVNNENFVGSRSLSIITTDGVFHSFNIVYNPNVKYTTYYAAQNDSSIKTTINVTTDKSTHLIFPHKVIYSDVGNEEVLTSETISSNNILKIKSLTQDSILSSSLFVVTEDKKYYEFIMNFNAKAESYTYNFSTTDNPAIFENTTNDKILIQVAEKCLQQKKTIFMIGERRNQLTCYLNNVNINNDVLYFSFEIINTSTLNMNIDFMRCFIKDKQTIKNSPEHEIESSPILNYKYLTMIPSNTSNRFILAFPKFTIPDKKKFEVQIFDKDGGRHLAFTINENFIINAKPI